MEITRMNADLPNIMASLDIIDIENVVSNTHSIESVSDTPSDTITDKRVLRKRKLLINDAKPTNRRVTIKPRKRTASMFSPKEIEDLYLNKKIKTSSQTLETIYEESNLENNESVTLISGKKIRRHLTFQLGSHYTKEKIKKRRAKIKKLLGSKSFLNRKRIPMSVFLKSIEQPDKGKNDVNSCHKSDTQSN